MVIASGCGPRKRASYGPPDIRRVTGVGVGHAPIAPPQYSAPAPPPAPAAPSYNIGGVAAAEGFGVPNPGAPGGQGRLMARRAAMSDARRNLLEQIQGASVSSSTTVQNFMTQNDTIQTRVQGLVQNATVVDEQQMPDGTYRVAMQIDMNQVSQILNQYGAPQAPPPAYNTPRAVAPQPTYGGGVNPAQERAKARRAAKVDAWRQLLEMAKGVQISSTTTVQDFMLVNDSNRARVEGIIRGAREVDTRYMPDGSVEVDMEFDMNQVRYNVR
jgi:hypothetical protein